MNRADVWVVKRGNGARLALEAVAPVCIGGDVFGNLDRDLPPQTRVLRAEDLAHPARAKRAGDFVWTEAGASTDRHDEGREGTIKPPTLVTRLAN